MEMILGMASDLVVTVVMGLLVILFAWVKKYLAEKISLIQGEQERKIATAALSRVDNIAELVVKKMQQTFVTDMKEKSADGKLTDSEIREIRLNTTKELSGLMNNQLRFDLKETVGDVDLYLQNLIEAKVLDLKQWKNLLEIDSNTAEVSKVTTDELEETEAAIM